MWPGELYIYGVYIYILSANLNECTTDFLSFPLLPFLVQFEEQQAFQRSRRFLRQLEISFGENPSHYQKIIKALQGGDDLSQASIHEVPKPN